MCVCVLHGYYPQARNPDSSRNSCWIWNSLSSTDGSTMPPHPRADGPHHSSAETSLPRKPSVPESISSGGFEPATSRCVARSSSLFNVAAYDGKRHIKRPHAYAFTQNRGHICLPAGGEPRPEQPQVLAPYGCSTSQEVAGSIPYIVLAQFRLELTKLSCLCLVNPLTNAHLPVPVPPGPRLFQRQGVWLRFSD